MLICKKKLAPAPKPTKLHIIFVSPWIYSKDFAWPRAMITVPSIHSIPAHGAVTGAVD